ncbi:hypothetical protein [Lentzea flava]|uniref:DUF4254 domain-containing protein n=1 Tax=Lentzea flava TaxID=103732 RepID=A0ABQ2VD43_9PSEU|nr:hypothetical protein [Lentzea flava]MCP2204733.1 hypothetical protein [Lentzea flava]GGU80858.1 hypothetical protein GCM10010178_84490 [Lentzea flava]
MEPDQARELLRRRIDAYSDELCDQAMRMLDQLTALRESVDQTETRPAVDAALVAFVAACRKVAFDHAFFGSLPGPRPQSRLIAAQDQAAVDAVVDGLDSLQQLFNRHAEFQEWVDATNNAREYRAAATYVQHARVTLT